MSATQWLLVALGVTILLYAGFIGALVAAGRHGSARAVAGFVPDCIVLFRRLLADARVPRSRRLVLWALIAYLALPFDIVPTSSPWPGSSTTSSPSRSSCVSCCAAVAT